MAIVLIGALALFGAAVAGWRFHSARRDSRSVEAHHQVLDRLRRAAEAPTQPHPPGPHVRLVPASGERRAEGPPAAPTPAQPVPPIPPIPLVEAVRPRRAGVGAVAVGALAAAVVAAAIAASVVALGGSSPGRPAPTQAAATRPVHHPAAARAAAPAAAVAPRRAGPTATSTTPTGATYVVSSAPVSLTMQATGRCWVEVRAGSSSGPVVFQGLLTPGATRAFKSQGGLWVRVGYPAGVSVALDGSRVTMPTNGLPYDLSVEYA